MAHESVYRTGQIARLLGVSYRTVAGWVDSGRLPGYRIPSQKAQASNKRHRRIRHGDLITFLERNHMPVPGSLATVSTPTVLMVGDGLPTIDDRRVEYATTPFSAGLAWAEWHHPYVVICLDYDPCNYPVIAKRLLDDPHRPRLLLVTGFDLPESLKDLDIDAIATIEELLIRIGQILGQRPSAAKGASSSSW